MGRKPTVKRVEDTPNVGHCVVCGASGKTPDDFICSECGDPLEATLFCRNCLRRLTLEPETARAFLADYGYEFEDVRGIVLKVDRCGSCMSDGQVVDMDVYRLRFGR